MPDKKLRILIADEVDEQLVHIERNLNHLGYFRVVPVASLDELLAMVQSAYEPFDLLIANTDMAVRSGVDLARFCDDSPQIHHALLYESPKAVPETLESTDLQVNGKLAQLPDPDALRNLMQIVESHHAPAEHKVVILGAVTRPKRRTAKLSRNL